ncbi:MAG: hypothetical protein II984_11270, partial [Clostridia bacterium]|nr:hypothetical protein [Clostridia bacterium]
MKESKKSKAAAVSPKRNENYKSNKSKKAKKGSGILKAIGRAMPYILTILCVVSLFSLVGLLGNFGSAIKNTLYGIFSNFATYFIPLFMLYHALMWYYDTKRKICFRRVLCSFFALFGMSTLQHIITVTVDTDLAQIKNISALYSKGVSGEGGGVIGGLLARVLTSIG